VAAVSPSQVNSDWNATTGVAAILNKPTIPAATTDASLLTSGTLADARLSSNVTLDNINNPFTAGQTITAPANNSALTASYSVTGANTTPLLDLSGTWNTSGIARGILLNITDTASPSTSRLLDLQTAGTSRFSVTKNGQVSTFGGLYVGSQFVADGNQARVASNGTIGFAPGTNAASSADTILARDAANTLALRNGGTAGTPAPNAFRVYNYTDAGLTNFERGFMRWNSNVLEIGTEAGGTGTARQLRIPLGTVTTSTPLEITQTWNNSSASFDAFRVSVTNTASQSANTTLLNLLVGGTSVFFVDRNGNSQWGTSVQVGASVGSGAWRGFAFNSIAQIGWGSGNPWDTVDLALRRSSAGVVEVNNGTAGTFRDLRVRNTIQRSGIATTVTPATNGDLVIEQTSDTSITFKMKGSDGTVRSASLTLA
jgi:hypothetical protein